MKKKQHLPMYGVGPIYVMVIIAADACGILLSAAERLPVVGFGLLRLPLALLGVVLIAGGVFLWYSVVIRANDILFFDWFLLCRSGFFAHYYPEVKGIYGSEIFGYNKKNHLIQIVPMLADSLLLAWICILM